MSIVGGRTTRVVPGGVAASVTAVTIATSANRPTYLSNAGTRSSSDVTSAFISDTTRPRYANTELAAPTIEDSGAQGAYGLGTFSDPEQDDQSPCRLIHAAILRAGICTVLCCS
ncbi:hypothetical protein E4U61_001068 [Claviceps capensis]|nr:hypothetical protein E4U61_001068 [Claviceps capensis]